MSQSAKPSESSIQLIHVNGNPISISSNTNLPVHVQDQNQRSIVNPTNQTVLPVVCNPTFGNRLIIPDVFRKLLVSPVTVHTPASTATYIANHSPVSPVRATVSPTTQTFVRTTNSLQAYSASIATGMENKHFLLCQL